jgi:exonuclease VII small subunit
LNKSGIDEGEKKLEKSLKMWENSFQLRFTCYDNVDEMERCFSQVNST